MEEGELRRYLLEAFRDMDQETRHISFETIAAMASGKPVLLSPELKDHLAQCGQCRGRLREFEQFALDSQNPPPADLSGEWESLQRRLRLQKKLEGPRMWLTAAAAAVVFAALSWMAIQRFSSDPQRLLAQAYAEQRSSEFRMAGASYGPLRQERGNESPFHLPPSLLKAQSRLAEELQATPEDPDVLRLQGEAEMMARDATAAVNTLQRAADLRPQDAHILADLGAAYALRGDATGGQLADYNRALDLLSRSLHIQPQFPEVVFNRALVLERMKLLDQAIQEWQGYLRLEPDANWAQEARKRLADLESKMKSRADGLAGIQADPAKFLALASTGAQIDVEAYLQDYAVTEWLPRSQVDTNARAAVDKLKESLQQKGDAWLADLAGSGPGPDTLAAIAKLKAAQDEITSGHFELALASAHEAGSGFLHGGNIAGAMQARLLQVIVLKDLVKYDDCLAAANALEQDLARHPYIQLRARVRIEHAICAMRLGDLKKAAALLRLAIKLSETAGLDATALEANNRYLAALAHVGLQSDVFSHAKRSLDIFWSGAYPARLFHQVVYDLRLMASDANQQYTAWFLARSSVWAATEDGNRLRQAMSRAILAVRAEQVGEHAEAQANLQLSDQLFVQLLPAYRIESQIDFAEMELERGQVNGALQRLQALHNDLPPGPSLASVRYYSALGEASRQKGLLREAIDAFHQSIALGSQRNRSMAPDRERAGILKTIEGSYRGLVAAMLAEGDSPSSALEAWQSYRAQDAGISIADVQSHRGSVLGFIELPDELLSWLVHDGRATLHRLDVSKETMTEVIARFRRECGNPTENDRLLHQHARQLYQWMIDPFAAQLSGQDGNVVIDLDGIFSAVPIQALEAGDGTQFADRFSITVVSAYARGSSQWTLEPNAIAVIVANPAVTGDSAVKFPPLPASLEEAGIVRAVFPRSILMEGNAASIASLTAALPEAGVVHFAGHGSTDWENGALVFTANPSMGGDYDLLRASDLQRQNWSRSRLVVLSACATAQGETAGAHNPDSLVRALTRAGASRVLASSWNVDSDATAALMKAFYASLAAGTAPDRALQAAEQSVRSRPGWKHPHYWAGFQLYGIV